MNYITIKPEGISEKDYHRKRMEELGFSGMNVHFDCCDGVFSVKKGTPLHERMKQRRMLSAEELTQSLCPVCTGDSNELRELVEDASRIERRIEFLIQLEDEDSQSIDSLVEISYRLSRIIHEYISEYPEFLGYND